MILKNYQDSSKERFKSVDHQPKLKSSVIHNSEFSEKFVQMAKNIDTPIEKLDIRKQFKLKLPRLG